MKEGKRMGSVLIISERAKRLAELVSEIETTGFQVLVKRYSVFDSKMPSGFNYDFVIYDLSSDFSEDLYRLRVLVSNAPVPVYACVKNLSDAEECEIYKAGVCGVIRTATNPKVTALRINAITELLIKTSRVSNRIVIGPVEIDLNNRLIIKEGEKIKLTNAESKILRILIKNVNTVVDKDSVIQYAWNDDESATDNALGIHIARLRQKVEYDPNSPVIDTIWGIGYRFNKPILD